MIPVPETGTPALLTGHTWLAIVGATLGLAAAAYSLLACVGSALRPRRAIPAANSHLPPITVLKPLFGAEPRLYQNLRSFCLQDAPVVQIIFAVRDGCDPAIAVVRRLQREFPAHNLTLVVDPTRHGSNAKVSNLTNAMRRAEHDYLVIADSDIGVPPDYLRRVVTPLLNPRTGIVTTPYVGRPVSGRWSQLGAQFINGWFMPSVAVAALFGSREFAFGATIALRRQTLTDIGGFEAIGNQLADDYRLGELTRARGLRTVLSEVVVETSVEEPTLAALVDHELRWMRTIRSVRPGGYAAAFTTFPLPMALLGALLSGFGDIAAAALAFTALARLVLHFYWRPRGDRSSWTALWALPLHDFVVFGVWCWGFLGQKVKWRQSSFHVTRDGAVHPLRRLDGRLMAPPLENE